MRHLARRMAGKLGRSGLNRAAPLGILAQDLLSRAENPGPGLFAKDSAFAPAARKPAKVYGRVGDLEVRLSNTRDDIESAQRLRYEVFYEKMASPDLHGWDAPSR